MAKLQDDDLEKLVFTESKYKFDDLTKTLSNGHSVIDFHKVEKMGFLINILITQRGAVGKTLNAKIKAMDDFLETGRPSLWLMNTTEQIKKEKINFLMDMTKPNVFDEMSNEEKDIWSEAKMDGSAKSGTASLQYDKGRVMGLTSLTQAEMNKGARVNWKSMFWDEFNVKWDKIQNGTDLIDSLFGTLMDPVANAGNNNIQDFKVYIFGNYKTLNHPFLTQYGISHIDHEITEVHTTDGIPLISIIKPVLTEEQRAFIDKQNTLNPIYRLAKVKGADKAMFFNESLYDEVNFIKMYKLLKEEQPHLDMEATIYHKGQYYDVYRNREDLTYHINRISKRGITHERAFSLSRRDVKENVIYRPSLRLKLAKQVAGSNMTFEDVASRALFISSITKT